MQLGDFEIHSVPMGRFWLDGGSVFGVVPKTIWGRYHEADDKNRIELALRNLVVKTGNRVILIDVGIGDNFSDKYKDIYRIDLEIENTAASLKSLGLSPHDITDVIVTHLHFDHIGGAFTNASSNPEPVYPNARYHIQQRQWEWGKHPSLKDHGSFKGDFYLPIEKTNELVLPDGPWEINSSFTVTVYDGHTPGLQLPVIRSGGKTFFFAGDLMPVAAQTAVPFLMSFDVDPLKTINEKTVTLETAVKEKWMMFFQHDVNVEGAYIEKGGRHFQVCDKFSID